MRVKKQKRHRKVVRFYSSCFGFREPFKVLCDGTFVHHLLLHRLTPADDALSRLLAARTTLFTTKCAVAELRCLGESHAEAFHAAQQLLTARCEHEKRVNAASCIESVIGEANEEHFFVATQDAELRKKLQQIPGAPVVYGLRNSLFLEKPSAEDVKFVKLSEEKRLHIGDLEAEILQKRKLKDILPSGGKTESPETNDGMEEVERTKKNMKRKGAVLADKWQFKRKGAKDDGSGTVNMKKRNRKRKRGKSSTRTGE